MSNVVMAIACHPDDIEFMMAGTLLQLQKTGYEVHYLNVANGSLGSDQLKHDEIVAMRRSEAMHSARLAGFIYHESLFDDLEVYYNYDAIGKVLGVLREVQPEVLLTHGPYDYMEDHVNTGRLAVTAAFCRGMGNYKCPCPDSGRVSNWDVAIYHSMPHSLSDALRRPVIPGLYVNTADTFEVQRQMLACHKSQKEWLDVSQGNNAYIEELNFRGRHYGSHSKVFEYAEGWIRHSNVGFCAPDFNPLAAALGAGVKIDDDFERALSWPS